MSGKAALAQEHVHPGTVAMLAATLFQGMSAEDKLDICERGHWISSSTNQSMETAAWSRLAKMAWNLAEECEAEGRRRREQP